MTTANAHNEWPKYRFCTDTQNGFITAPDFDHAVKQLHDLFPNEIPNGAFGWVEDHDGYRHNIGERC